MDKEFYFVGEAAKEIGVSTLTLKNYEARGLISPDMRLPNGKRIYTKETIDAYIRRISTKK